jgi:hypothetical protein
MRIIKHWFGYRQQNPKGRQGGSDLDKLNPTRWSLAMTEELRDLVAVLEGCVLLQEKQTDLLDRIMASPLITTAELEEASIVPPPQELRHIAKDSEGSALF